jgi:hypothetical protein
VIQEYAGKCPYVTGRDEGGYRLLVAVACFVEGIPDQVYALLDTGSEWCVLPPSIAVRAGFGLIEEEAPVALSTRFGILHGRLERVSIRFDATEGQEMDQDATCFVSSEWPGPMVIGWSGCLERMRFGFDTTEEAFYFGSG